MATLLSTQPTHPLFSFLGRKRASDIESQNGDATNGATNGAESSVGRPASIRLTRLSRNRSERVVDRRSANYSQPTGGTVSITVGSSDNTKTFVLDHLLLVDSSDYFKENITGPYDLLDVDPVVFGLYSSWIESPEFLVCYNPDFITEEPWLSNAAAACLLGMQLRSEAFEKYALSQFIQCCALIPIGPWKEIEKSARWNSPLRRFSNHWIAWHTYILGPGPNEFRDLIGRLAASKVTEMTRDPRILDIEHWYAACGDRFDAGCDHDPISNQEKMEELNRVVEPPPPEWGRSFEEGRSGRARRRSRSGQRSGSSPWIPGPQIRSNSPSNPTIVSPYLTKISARVCGGIFCAIFGIIFAGQILAILVICVNMVKKRGSGIRYTTRTYSLFVGVVGGITALVPFLFPIYGFFGFGAGIATIQDTKTCWSLLKSGVSYCDPNTATYYGYSYIPDGCPTTSSCRQVEILTILIWSSFPIVIFYCGTLAVVLD